MEKATSSITYGATLRCCQRISCLKNSTMEGGSNIHDHSLGRQRRIWTLVRSVERKRIRGDLCD